MENCPLQQVLCFKEGTDKDIQKRQEAFIYILLNGMNRIRALRQMLVCRRDEMRIPAVKRRQQESFFTLKLFYGYKLSNSCE